MMSSFEDAVSLRLLQLKSLLVDTQRLRRELIQSLKELFEIASEWAKRDPKAARLAGYIAQVMNSLARSYEERELNDDIRELERMIEQAKAWLEAKEQEEA